MQGKIGAIGVSNFSVEQMERFRAVAPIHVLQPPYNLFEREIEADILPYCLKHGIATLGYGALCRGLLSGRMKADTAFGPGDLRRDDPKFRPPRYAHYLAAVARLDRLAQERFGKRVIHLAARWVLDQGVAVGALGRPPPRSVGTDRRSIRLDARHRGKSRDRPDSPRRNPGSRRPRVHGPARARLALADIAPASHLNRRGCGDQRQCAAIRVRRP